ncbi:hypothetical protein Z517_01599 [Fonsecaea pedrosoi CBS 271.37]|uniref:Uncharacterized protein n=1 Tax=Fonsecaea pedrosoi CBS 271.37 TaxID=1442368 RepID=A0A0D2HP15_9EURO|nr:uncharacterized protein Z517_01599 [Fonsecaea pedrosoi CBS 271.37]KIW86204.1 hypothetical protein Z517_01599 [Fonsecaea pedrosoi CBS 271.37]
MSQGGEDEAKSGLVPGLSQSSEASLSSDTVCDLGEDDRDLEKEDVALLNAKELGSTHARTTARRCRLPKSILLWTFFIALAALSFLVYWLLPLKMNQTPTFHPVFGDCGKTPDQARTKGCVYDPLAVTWVRPECYYPELIEEFINMEPVAFYHDKSLTKESLVPLEEIIQAQHEQVWAPHKFHSVHCAHVVKKVHHALMNHFPIDSFSLNYAHTEHCQLVLLEELPQCAAPGTCRLNNVIQKYSSCGYVY